MSEQKKSSFDEQKKASFDFVTELTKQLISLPTLIIGLMMTLGGKTISDAGVNAFLGPSLCFLVSIIAGLGVLMKLSGELSKSTGDDLDIYKAKYFTIVQMLSFGVGMLWLIIAFTYSKV